MFQRSKAKEARQSPWVPTMRTWTFDAKKNELVQAGGAVQSRHASILLADHRVLTLGGDGKVDPDLLFLERGLAYREKAAVD